MSQVSGESGALLAHSHDALQLRADHRGGVCCSRSISLLRGVHLTSASLESCRCSTGGVCCNCTRREVHLSSGGCELCRSSSSGVLEHMRPTWSAFSAGLRLVSCMCFLCLRCTQHTRCYIFPASGRDKAVKQPQPPRGSKRIHRAGVSSKSACDAPTKQRRVALQRRRPEERTHKRDLEGCRLSVCTVLSHAGVCGDHPDVPHHTLTSSTT